MEIPETVVNIHRSPADRLHKSADTQYIMSFFGGSGPPPKSKVIFKEFRLKSLQKRPLNSRLGEEQRKMGSSERRPAEVYRFSSFH